ncbi:MAG: TrkA family potassium uptake protein [Elusimicrobiota bacterium]|nr:TrkA family potassium uptake protein [Elusimicrobiota bacterium]
MNKKNHFLILGLGTFGMTLAKCLSEKGAEVIAIDKDEKKVEEISGFVSQAMTGDASDEKMLKSLGLEDIDIAVVAIGENLEDSILATLHLRESQVKKIIVKCINQLHAKISAKLGADRIVYPEVEMAKKLAESFISPNILEEIELSPEYNIVEIVLPKKFIGKSIRQVGLRAEFGVNLIAIKRKMPYLTDSGESDFKEEIIIAPTADEEFQDGDILVVVGKDADIEKLKHK